MSTNSQNILENAEKYWLAARALDYVSTLSREDVRPYYLPETFDDVDVVQPKMVLELFSIELYLKALLAYRNGGYKRTHDVSKLFRSLPEVDRKAIHHRCTEREMPYADGSAPSDRTLLTPDEVLHEIRDYFIKWRYSFDKAEMDALYDRKEVVPEIFYVSDVIRDYIRKVLLDQHGT